jgi:multiple sugar transport system substrate-binding protein
MKRIVALLIGLIVVLSGWWIAASGSRVQPEEGVLDVWVTWAEDPDQLQALFVRYSEAIGLPVRVTTGLKGDKALKAMTDSAPPDIVVLSSNDLVRSAYERGLVEPLDPWIEATGIDLDDFYPASLAQCETPDGTTLCLPWGCDVYALFWNKELFRAAGLDPERPPQTMEELVEYADKLTVRYEEGGLSQVGFIPDFARSHTELYARLFGGAWTSENGAELTANDQPMIDAVNWQRQFYDRVGTQEAVEFVSSLDRYLDSHHPVSAGKRLSCQQCHRNPPRNSDRLPDHGFYTGKVAMMVAGQWQVGPDYIPFFQPELDYGVAPFPLPAGHPERASTSVVQGPVIIIPAAAGDKEAAASLLAWMVSPEIMAEANATHASLPARRAAIQDPRFLNVPGLEVFIDLLAHSNAMHAISMPISPELNEALGQVEDEVLHNGGDPVGLLNEVQSEFASRLREALGK